MWCLFLQSVLSFTLFSKISTFFLSFARVDLNVWVSDCVISSQAYRDPMLKLSIMTEHELNQIFGTLDSLIPLHEGEQKSVCLNQAQCHTFTAGSVYPKWRRKAVRSDPITVNQNPSNGNCTVSQSWYHLLHDKMEYWFKFKLCYYVRRQHRRSHKYLPEHLKSDPLVPTQYPCFHPKLWI